jgi:predicted metalloprotease with PDZ domain
MEYVHYKISAAKSHNHFLQIQITHHNPHLHSHIQLSIAAWRPGRYELQQYARNIRNVEANDGNGNNLLIHKIDRNNWLVQSNQAEVIYMNYEYYAYQMDAGGCWVDSNQIYLNFISCLLHVERKHDLPIKIKLALPVNYTIACGLMSENNEIVAENFYQIADSPMVASSTLQYVQYTVDETAFTIWLQGEQQLDKQRLAEDFTKFTIAQKQLFGNFPFEKYYFIIQCLPYAHYHGVEHNNSTVIVLGIGKDLHLEHNYQQLLGIASHELFHAWNICKIRPIQMLPYDFSKETYFHTGFVAEGFTTYYGDLMLHRSQIFDNNRYQKELNNVLKQHFQTIGNENYTLSESSLDLWVDGYISGIPDRKVSIYTKGAVLAWLLDLSIQHYTNGEGSLDQVLQILWQDYGKPQKGYSIQDIFNIIYEVGGSETLQILEEGVFGKTYLTHYINYLAPQAGYQVTLKEPANWIEAKLGAKVVKVAEGFKITNIATDSPACHTLCVGDIIVDALDKIEADYLQNHLELVQYEIEIRRDFQLQRVIINTDNQTYFKWYEVQK